MIEDIKKLFSSVIEKHPEAADILATELNKIPNNLMALIAEFSKKTIVGIYPAYKGSLTLSIFTSPHVISSRYPEKEKDFTPSRIYTKRSSFVKLMPRMMVIQSRCIQDIMDYKMMLEKEIRNIKISSPSIS